ncbi:MAG: hypothetical protein M3157_02610 [Actinomycetota bacterium]|nr:hypothetical protein [Actinomycetota bacterium]
MTRIVFGHDEARVSRKLGGQPREEVDAVGIITGNTDDTVSRLGSLAEAGVQRVMLQYMDTDDIDTLEEISRSVLPQLR